jgi:hypothetical protein
LSLPAHLAPGRLIMLTLGFAAQPINRCARPSLSQPLGLPSSAQAHRWVFQRCPSLAQQHAQRRCLQLRSVRLFSASSSLGPPASSIAGSSNVFLGALLCHRLRRGCRCRHQPQHRSSAQSGAGERTGIITSAGPRPHGLRLSSHSFFCPVFPEGTHDSSPPLQSSKGYWSHCFSSDVDYWSRCSTPHFPHSPMLPPVRHSANSGGASLFLLPQFATRLTRGEHSYFFLSSPSSSLTNSRGAFLLILELP